MLAENLLDDISFSKEEQEQYHQISKIAGAALEGFAKDYMLGKISFQKALSLMENINIPELHIYTVNLMFLLECSSFLLEKYKKAHISDELFINAMRDIKYKLDECKRTKKIYGISTMKWYEGFLTLERLAIGRLQYDITLSEEPIQLQNHYIDTGDLILSCHIPSSGPLKPELCLESFKMAYNFFKDRLSNEILPIKCVSWLMYPPYKKVFGEQSNITDFVRNFEIVNVRDTDCFNDSWRVFGEDYDGNEDKLSRHTQLQRSFVDYIKQGNGFGFATGIMLFDGERVLTRK